MIGDRYLTDVVYGNRNGLFTIRPAPLTLEGEPSAVLLVSCLLGFWYKSATDLRGTGRCFLDVQCHCYPLLACGVH